MTPFVIFHIPYQVPFHLYCSFPDHSLRHPLYSSQVTCLCFHWLCISFLLITLRSWSLLIHASFQAVLLHILHNRMQISYAVREVSLNNWYFWSAPLPLRTVSQGISSINSLNSWNFTLLKFRALTVFARHMFFKTESKNRPWAPQLILLPVLTPFMNPFALVSTDRCTSRCIHTNLWMYNMQITFQKSILTQKMNIIL